MVTLDCSLYQPASKPCGALRFRHSGTVTSAGPVASPSILAVLICYAAQGVFAVSYLLKGLQVGLAVIERDNVSSL